jgi:hypothetical protein
MDLRNELVMLCTVTREQLNILGVVSKTFSSNIQYYINISSLRTLSIKVIIIKYI